MNFVYIIVKQNVMSKGDLKTQGLKGNNFPYQFNVLQLLGMIVGNTDQVEALLQAIEDNTDGIEGLLSQILASVQSDKDFEASFVKDANGQVWLEIRTLDLDTNVWSIAYYMPGDLTPHQLQPGDPAGPLGPLTYESPASLLALILAELVAHTALLTDIDNNTDNIEPLLTQLEACCQAGNLLLQSIDAKDFATETTLAAFALANNTALGLIETAVTNADANIVAAIQACCTAQGTILSNILIELQSQTGLLTNIDADTTGILNELVAQTIQNTAIINALAPLATETTLAAVLTELQGINLDTNGLSQEATQLLVLAAINSVVANTTGLATEVTLNSLLTAFNAEDFASQTTLAALLTAFNAEDFATETTLAAIQTILANLTFTGGDLNVSANIQVGGTDVSGANPVPVTFASGTETPYYVEYAGILAATATPAGAKSLSLFNEGPSRWELSSDAGVTWVDFNEGQIVEWAASEGKTLNSILFRRTVAGGRLVMSYTI
jgi:hypothetical protein